MGLLGKVPHLLLPDLNEIAGDLERHGDLPSLLRYSVNSLSLVNFGLAAPMGWGELLPARTSGVGPLVN